MDLRNTAVAVVLIGTSLATACKPSSEAARTESGSVSEAAPDAFYCPMHPSYRSDRPGDCPICNMKLVPLETPAGKPAVQPADEAALFTCPMHPSYRSDRPGDCPICNMKLVPLEASGRSQAGTVKDHAAVEIAPAMQQRIGVRVEVARKAPFARTIRAAARVEPDERKLSAVALKVGGWVEELFVQAVGQPVDVGEPLLTIYSPELYEAQRSYLAARAGLQPSDELLASARKRLELWDLGPEDLAALEGGGEPAPRVTLHSKVRGVVTRREVVPGTYVEPGRTLLEVADLSSVWVQADLYESELADVRAGLPATVELFGLSGESIRGKVAYVYPWVEAATRTARARVEVDNPEGRIKPGMFGTLSIAVDLGERIAVDDDAVLETGTRSIVFVLVDGARFEPREVVLGARSEGRVVIEKGVEAGEKVVASGTFLVDSESRLKAALHGMAAVPGSEGRQEKQSGGEHQH